MTYMPTPFATRQITPGAVTPYASVPYLSVSEYRFAPTSVGTNTLVGKSTSPQTDSNASLATIIARASGWIDDKCFHRDGTFVAQPITEQMWVTVKPTGQLVLLTNLKPIREVVGVALGPAASQLMDIGPGAAADITTGDSTITLPGYWCGKRPMFGGYPANNGKVYCVYSYIAGYAHMTLAEPAIAGATSITVNPPFPGATFPYQCFAGSPLTIRDGANTEDIVLSATPTSLTLSLASGLQYAHTPPVVPDSITVSNLPWTIEQACVYLTNVITKTRGFRAFVLPPGTGAPSPTARKTMGRAGVLDDFEEACRLLHPFRVVTRH